MRAKLFTALAALLLPALSASAGPADPPRPDKVRAWIIEWAGGAKPAVQTGEVTFMPGRDRGVLAIIGFEARGKRRELFGGYFTNITTTTSNHYYPAVWAEGHGNLIPACQVSAACENQLPWTAEKRALDGNIPGKRSYYVIAQNFDVQKITTSPGWKPPRELAAPPAVRLVRKSGDGVRVNWAGVEHFTGASAPGGRYGSAALAWIPCDLPGGSGSAVLRGGEPVPHPYAKPNDGTHHVRCDTSSTVAWSATSRPTTWHLDGEATGYTAIPDRLVVVDLPRFP